MNKKLIVALSIFVLSGCQLVPSNSSTSSNTVSNTSSTNENSSTNTYSDVITSTSSSSLTSTSTSSSSTTSSSSSTTSSSSSTTSSSSSTTSSSSSTTSSSSSTISSNSSTTSSSSSTSTSSSSTSTSTPDVSLKQGLKGSEWLNYYGEASYCYSVPSTGNPNMLVVPVLFEGESVGNSSQVLEDIETVFNGKSQETSWESVDTFYQKSSYGKLDMDITVLDYWVTLDKTCSELAALSSNKYADPTWYALNFVVDYLKDSGMDMKNYDSNGDGYIDGVWMVYGKNYSSATSAQEDIMWAYTYWHYDNTPDKKSPTANVYAWASIEFMYEGGYEKPDAHTFIHETGHMLGLDDYYNYDSNSSANPTGCLDMMDYNIGDHNSHSKYLLDWVNPTYVTKETTITIDAFESSGDCIVVPTSLNNNMSPMDEYLIIEFYTPTGLNEADALKSYQNSYPKLFTQNGIKIYHVDSRIGKLTYTSGEYEYGSYKYNASYEDLMDETDYYSYFDIFASNTPSYSYSSNYKKLTLLSSNQNSKKGYYYPNTYAKNTDLYLEGDSVSKFTFNKGTSLLFEITIDEITSSSATISFS